MDGFVICLELGVVECVFLCIGDIYCVYNVFDDCILISIYVYGGNIGGIYCFVYMEDGECKFFVFGYLNIYLFNFWDCFKDMFVL